MIVNEIPRIVPKIPEALLPSALPNAYQISADAFLGKIQRHKFHESSYQIWGSPSRCSDSDSYAIHSIWRARSRCLQRHKNSPVGSSSGRHRPMSRIGRIRKVSTL